GVVEQPGDRGVPRGRDATVVRRARGAADTGHVDVVLERHGQTVQAPPPRGWRRVPFVGLPPRAVGEHRDERAQIPIAFPRARQVPLDSFPDRTHLVSFPCRKTGSAGTPGYRPPRRTRDHAACRDARTLAVASSSTVIVDSSITTP